MDKNFGYLMLSLGLFITIVAIGYGWVCLVARRKAEHRERMQELERKAQSRRPTQSPPVRNPGQTVHSGKVDRTLQPGNSSVPGSSRASEPVLFDPLNPLNPLSPISPFNQVSDPTPSRCEPSSGGWESIGGGGSGSDYSSSSCDSSSSSSSSSSFD